MDTDKIHLTLLENRNKNGFYKKEALLVGGIFFFWILVAFYLNGFRDTVFFVSASAALAIVTWKMFDVFLQRERKYGELLQKLANTEIYDIISDQERLLQQAREERDSMLREAREMKEEMIEEARQAAQREAAEIIQSKVSEELAKGILEAKGKGLATSLEKLYTQEQSSILETFEFLRADDHLRELMGNLAEMLERTYNTYNASRSDRESWEIRKNRYFLADFQSFMTSFSYLAERSGESSKMLYELYVLLSIQRALNLLYDLNASTMYMHARKLPNSKAPISRGTRKKLK